MSFPAKFTYSSYTFLLLKTNHCIALYEQRKGKKVFGYEVHVLNSSPNYIQPKSAFGRTAWCYQHRESAEKKYSELIGEKI